MLYDSLENISLYKGLSKNLDTAIAYIEEHELTELPLGRTEIDGDAVFVSVTESALRTSAAADFEAHHKYMDLQTDLAGCEMFEVALAETKQAKPFDAANDCGMLKGVASAAGTLGEGRFAVFFANEPHKPALKAPNCAKVKKAVFKISDDTVPAAE